MKFRVQIKGLLKAIDPVMPIAKSGAEKEYEHGGHMTLKAQKNSLVISADNSRIRVSNEVANSEVADLDYSNDEAGALTLNSVMLMDTLASFDVTDIVEFAEEKDTSGGRCLSVTIVGSDDEKQTMPVYDDAIKQVSSKNMDDESRRILRRDLFVEGAGKLLFTHAVSSESEAKYRHWIMRFDQDYIRFVAGDGPRYAAVDFRGDSITDADSASSDILFPTDQTKNFIDSVKNLTVDRIEFFYNDSPVFYARCGTLSYEIRGIDPTVVFPQEDRILRRQSSIRFTTKLGAWNKAVKGLLATYTNEMRSANKTHGSLLEIDVDNKEIIVSPIGSSSKARRRIEIENIEVKDIKDKTGSDIETPKQFRCLTIYLDHMLKQGSDEDIIQCELYKEDKPIVIRYFGDDEISDEDCARNNDAFGVKEGFSIFFISYNDVL